MITPFDKIFDLPKEPVVVFEDYYLVVLQKPFGYTVEKHAHYPSLENFALVHLQKHFPQNKKHFVGIVHRLDVSTAGLVVMAKTPQALKDLNHQFEEKTTVKKYLACVEGKPKSEGKLEGFITEDKVNRTAYFSQEETKGSKKSVLTYTIKENQENFSLLDITLETGRFHQIRACMQFLGCPVVNDERYGAKKVVEENKIWLCAHSLGIGHPKTGKVLFFSL